MRLGLVATLLALAAQLDAQLKLSISGKVTSESGAPIEGALVSLGNLGVASSTDVSGSYSLVIPLASNRAMFSLDVRARAIGHVPQTEAIRITIANDRINWVAGSSTMNFVLKSESAADAARARRQFSVARQDQGSGAAVPGQADPFGRFLFPPELVMQHQGELGLQESQREALQNAIQEAQTQMLRMQWALASEGEKLTKLLAAESLDEKEALAQVDRILMTEREIKRAQMTLMVRIRNTLTADQRAKLRALRSE